MPYTRSEEGSNNFEVGQLVKLKVPTTSVRLLQEGHGGYNPKMMECLQLPGEITNITSKGDLKVKFKENEIWTLNPLIMDIAQVNEIEQLENVEDLANPEPSSDIVVAQCMVCSEEEVMCLLEPCGHKVTCVECTTRLKVCNLCHVTITRRIAPGTDQTIEFIPKYERPTIEDLRRIERDYNELKEQLTCAVCFERNKDTLFNCGHSVCSICSYQIGNECHMCRVQIRTRSHMF